MSTNLFAALKRLLPDSPVWIGEVVSHNAAEDTSTIRLPTGEGDIAYAGAVQGGSLIRARGRTVPVGQNAFVRDGVVETQAPSGTPVAYVVGPVAIAPVGLVFNGPIPAQSANAGAAFSFDMNPYWTGGLAPRGWAVAAGTLPAGLTLNISTGVISGTPTTAAAAVSVSIRCTDAQLTSVVGSMTITIGAALATSGWSASEQQPGEGSITLSGGGKIATLAGTSGFSLPSLLSGTDISGKTYCEFEVTSQSSGSPLIHFFGVLATGIWTAQGKRFMCVQSAPQNTSEFAPGNANSAGPFFRIPPQASNNAAKVQGAGFSNPSGDVYDQAYAFAVGDRIGLAFDPTTRVLNLRKNGAWVNGEPGVASPFAALPAGTYRFAFLSPGIASPRRVLDRCSAVL